MFKTIKSQLSTIIELLAEIEQNTRWLLEENRKQCNTSCRTSKCVKTGTTFPSLKKIENAMKGTRRR